MKKTLYFLLAVCLPDIAYYFSYDFNTINLLMWLAPIPLLIYIEFAKGWQSALAAFLVGAATQLSTIVGYWHTLIPWTAHGLSMLQSGGQFLVVFLLLIWIKHKSRSWFSIFLYPVLMCMSEWLFSFTGVGTYLSIAYNQLLWLPVVQIASLAGYSAITFILSLFASTVAYVIVNIQQKKQVMMALLMAALIIGLSLVYGVLRIHLQNTEAYVKVGLVNKSLPLKQTLNPGNGVQIIRQYEQSFTVLVHQGAKIITIPEESLLVTPKTRPKLMSMLGRYAKQHHVYLIIGARLRDHKLYNVAWLFTPRGQLAGQYTKRHLVPVVESNYITPKKSLLTFNYHGYQFAVAICRDMDYPNPAAIYGKQNVNIVFVPAWDFKQDAWSHGKLAYMRGVEYGFGVVRAARDGYLSTSTKTGYFVNKVYAATSTPTTLLTNVPISKGGSFYAHYRWFMPILLLFLLIILFWACRKR